MKHSGDVGNQCFGRRGGAITDLVDGKTHSWEPQSESVVRETERLVACWIWWNCLSQE